MKRIVLIMLFFSLNVIYSQKDKIVKKALTDELKSELNAIKISDRKHRLYIIKNRDNLTETEIDSLWVLQSFIDLENTSKVLEIIEEFGYLSNSNAETNFPMHIVLMHTPKVLIDTVYKVINKEKEAGRIIKSSYGMIKWHLDGRREIKLKQFLKQNDSISKQ